MEVKKIYSLPILKDNTELFSNITRKTQFVITSAVVKLGAYEMRNSIVSQRYPIHSDRLLNLLDCQLETVNMIASQFFRQVMRIQYQPIVLYYLFY